LVKIYKEKQWNNIAILERLKFMLKTLNTNNQDLFLDLIEHYKIIKAQDYEKLLMEAVEKLIKDIDIEKYQKIYISPILKEVNGNKSEPLIKDGFVTQIKSGYYVCYLFKSLNMTFKNYFGTKKVNVVDVLSEKEIDEIKEGNSLLILADDYIGEGFSARTCIKNHEINRGISSENLIVVSLIIEEKGKELLQRHNIKYFDSNVKTYNVNQVLEKGNYNGESIKEMKKELKVSKKDRQKLGRGDIGSLVSLIRTPNNTLSMYWKTDSRKSLTPFPR